MLMQVNVGVVMDMKSRCRVLFANQSAMKDVFNGLTFYPANFIYDYGCARAMSVKPAYRVSPLNVLCKLYVYNCFCL